MQKFYIILPVLFLLSCYSVNNSFELKNGDLLFSVGKGDDDFLKAIQHSTSTGEEIPYSHVGIILIEDKKTFVLEATAPEGVIKSSLDDFFEESASLNGEKLVAVGRLDQAWQYTIPGAIKQALKHLGKEYDYLYNESNNAYYCSELVRDVFIDSIGNPLFEAVAMSFKDKSTGEIIPYWFEHFNQRNSKVPEGELGTNPADMSKSNKIHIVHKYYSVKPHK